MEVIVVTSVLILFIAFLLIIIVFKGTQFSAAEKRHRLISKEDNPLAEFHLSEGRCPKCNRKLV